MSQLLSSMDLFTTQPDQLEELNDDNTFFRISSTQMFFKMCVLQNFTIFTGKDLCWSLFLMKLQA